MKIELYDKLDSLEVIKLYLDDIDYTFIVEYLHEEYLDSTVFENFTEVNSKLRYINPRYAFYLSLFMLGHNCSETNFLKYLPKSVCDALIETGLVIYNGLSWHMPSLCIVPINGQYFVNYLPGTYPTYSSKVESTTIKGQVQFLSSINSISEMKTVIELFSTCGLLGIHSARNASCVKIHSVNLDAVKIIKINIGLNLLNDKVEVLNCTADNLVYRFENVFDCLLSVPQNFYKTLNSNEESFNYENENLLKAILLTNKLLAKGGCAKLFLQSFGDQHNININKVIVENITGNIDFKVIKKETVAEYIHNYLIRSMTDWEKKNIMIPNELNKKIKALENVLLNLNNPCDFVYTQIVKIQISEISKNILSPLYNPIYSDSLFIKAFSNKYTTFDEVQKT